MGLAELLTARRAAAAALVVAAAALAGCTGPGGPRSPDVVATVGPAEVTVAEVRARLPAQDTGPAVLRPGVPPPDHWRDALRLAIRDELLSLEAARRDPAATWAADPAGRAARIRAVAEQERAAQPRLRAETIPEAEARSWFEDNAGLFDRVESAHVTWAQFTDGDLARTVLATSAGLDRARFLQVVRDHGAEAATAVLDSSGHGADVLVGRVAFAVRQTGGVGLVPGADGLWWLVRVDDIGLATPTWDDELAGRVRAAMAWEREQAHLDALARRLEGRWPVVVDEQRFAASRPHEG